MEKIKKITNVKFNHEYTKMICAIGKSENISYTDVIRTYMLNRKSIIEDYQLIYKKNNLPDDNTHKGTFRGVFLDDEIEMITRIKDVYKIPIGKLIRVLVSTNYYTLQSLHDDTVDRFGDDCKVSKRELMQKGFSRLLPFVQK